MFIYWALFAIFAVGVLFAPAHGAGVSPRTGTPFGLAMAFLAMIVGLRYDVGGDWETYEFMFSFARYADLGQALEHGDPAYQFLSWSVQGLGLGIWAVNLICALLFVWGLGRLAKTQPSPWLSVLVAIPYLVIVVAMGYTRQAVAIGIIMAGIAALANGASLVRFALYVAVAALFHRTAVVVLPLLIFASERNRFLNAIAGVGALVLLYDVFLAKDVDLLVKNYIVAKYSSQGAAIRVVMNLVPSFIILTFGRRLQLSVTEFRISRAFAWTSCALLISLVLSPSSTAVDRIALYMIPLQLIILPRIGLLFRNALAGRFIVIVYAAAVQFTWINFADHAEYWLPYHFYPISR